MLVSQPKTRIEMDGPLGVPVTVAEGENTAVSVGFGAVVLVAVAAFVKVAIAGVEVFDPRTTGAGVWIRGVGVGGKKGVGPEPGWKTQPLQEESRNTNTSARIGVFIFCSSEIIVSRFYVHCKVACMRFGLDEFCSCNDDSKCHHPALRGPTATLSDSKDYNCPLSPHVSTFFWYSGSS